MLKKYKIAKAFEGQDMNIVIPEVGTVLLNADNLTDEMAEASTKAGGPFFEPVKEVVKPVNTPANGTN